MSQSMMFFLFCFFKFSPHFCIWWLQNIAMPDPGRSSPYGGLPYGVQPGGVSRIARCGSYMLNPHPYPSYKQGQESALCYLTHCGLVAPEIWVNIGSGNGLLPDGNKLLPEPMLTDHQWSPVTFIVGQFHKRCLNHQSLKSVWKLHT